MSLGNEYQKQVHTVLSQLESDLAKSKAEEENIRELMKKTEKTFQQQRIVQTQRMKTIRKLHDQYMKGMSDLDEAHRGQQTTMQSELKKEMALLQKKILMETVSGTSRIQIGISGIFFYSNSRSCPMYGAPSSRCWLKCSSSDIIPRYQNNTPQTHASLRREYKYKR